MTSSEQEDLADPALQAVDTPHGTLHRPRGEVIQLLCFAGAFLGGPALGALVGHALGGLSETAQIVLYLPFVAIFFLGYALWAARLQAIAFDGIGRSILKALFLLIIRRRKPRSIEDVLPSKEKLLEMAVRAQKAAWSFFLVSLPVAAVAGLIALLFDSEASAMTQALTVSGTCLLWGYVLGLLGRHGWLPIMENEG